MFDVGFSEIFVIAIVALIVIGPERLPTVARTVGTLLGRLNRYVSDVKADVEREMRLEEMKKLRADVEQQAMGIEQSVVRELESARTAVEQPAAEVQASLSEVMQETGQVGIAIQQSVAEAGGAVAATSVAVDLQKNDDNATLAAATGAPATRQAALDFDPLKHPSSTSLAASTPSAPSIQPAAKA